MGVRLVIGRTARPPLAPQVVRVTPAGVSSLPLIAIFTRPLEFKVAVPKTWRATSSAVLHAVIIGGHRSSDQRSCPSSGAIEPVVNARVPSPRDACVGAP